MAQKHRYNRQQKPRRATTRTETPARISLAGERKPPKQYGKPFILMEDQSKNTFEYARGAWTAYEMTIAEIRVDGQVKELPQKVNGMTRYEVRLSVPVAT